MNDRKGLDATDTAARPKRGNLPREKAAIRRVARKEAERWARSRKTFSTKKSL
jgi:hypothetical protein